MRNEPLRIYTKFTRFSYLSYAPDFVLNFQVVELQHRKDIDLYISQFTH